jgi:hypothetical protein
MLVFDPHHTRGIYDMIEQIISTSSSCNEENAEKLSGKQTAQTAP